MSNSKDPHLEIGEEARESLIRGFALHEQPVVEAARTNATACISFRRLTALATHAVPRSDDADHLRNCRRCRVSLETMEAEIGEEDMSKSGAALEAACMEMPETGIDLPRAVRPAPAARWTDEREITVSSVFGAMRSFLMDSEAGGRVGLDAAWSILNHIKKCALDAAQMHPRVYRRLAAAYADIVSMAPVAMKVVLIYGVTKMHEPGLLAMRIAAEIAERDDDAAHEVLSYAILTEAGDLAKRIPVERWNAIEKMTHAMLYPFRRTVDDELLKFRDEFVPSIPDDAIIKVLRTSLTAMTDDLFRSRPIEDSAETVLHLLAVRDYLGAVARHVGADSPMHVRLVPAIEAIVFERAREKCAPLLLAMEACERLRSPASTLTFVERLYGLEAPEVMTREGEGA